MTINLISGQEIHKENAWRNAFCVSLFFIGVIVWSVWTYQEKKVSVTQAAESEGALDSGMPIPSTPSEPAPPMLIGVDRIQEEIFSAEAILVKDVESDAILYQKQPEIIRPGASIVKLMSALVFLEDDVSWQSTTTVTHDAVVDTHMYEGDTYTIEELWNAALVASSNKAILTLVDTLPWGRDAFVERMNQKAMEIGMTHSTFVDPAGLATENQVTASDVVILFGEAMEQEKIRSTLLIKEGTLFSKERNKKHHFWNTNWLLLGWIPHGFSVFHGGKTGYTEAAGYNFVMRVEDSRGKVLDVAILGADANEARFIEARDIANWVFSQYEWVGAVTSTGE